MNIEITGYARIDLLIAFLTGASLVCIIIYTICRKMEELDRRGICKHCRYRGFRYTGVKPRTEGICIRQQKVVSVDPLTGYKTVTRCPTMKSERSHSGECGPDGGYWRIDNSIAVEFVKFALMLIAIGASLIILV